MEKQGPLSGNLVANRYLLGELLGSGGMGAVYKAQDTRLSRLVAMKVMSPASPVTAADLKHFTELFQTEALRLASLKHSGIPVIYDHFEEAPHWFLAMEFIEGETLNAYLQRHGGRLQVDKVLKIGLQLVDMLNYLHLRQPPIIFRDLKPANVMISTNGQIFLIDFGIARVFTPGKSQDTFVFLSSGYAAPEQYGTAQTTVRSDIYSLGATLHHLLSGTHPATSPFLFAPLPIQQPSQFASVIAKMLALDPTNRPTGMAEVKDALQRMVDQTATIGIPGDTIPASSASIPPTPLTAKQPTQPGTRPVPLAGMQPAPAISSIGGASSHTQIAPLLTPNRPPQGTTLLTHESFGSALAWSPDGQHIASGSKQLEKSYDGQQIAVSGKQVEIWEATTGKTLTLLDTYGEIKFVAWSPDGKYIIASEGVLKSPGGGWDSHPHYIHMVECLEVSEQSRRIFGFRKRKLDFSSFRYSEQEEVEKHSLFNENTFFDKDILLLWSPNGSKVVVSVLWHYALNQFIVSSLRDRKPIVQRSLISSANNNTVVWSPDSTRIAWGIENEIPVWDVSDTQREGFHLLTYRGHRSSIVAVSWSPDGTITSQSEDGSVQIWEAANGQKLKIFTAPVKKRREPIPLGTVIEKSAISPDGTLRAIATDNGIEIHTVSSEETVFVYRGHFSDKTALHWSPEVKALSWSPDGTRIAFTRFDGKIYVWQTV